MAVSLLAYVVTFFVFICNYALTIVALALPKWYANEQTSRPWPKQSGGPISLLIHLGCRSLPHCRYTWKQTMGFSAFVKGKKG